MADLSIRSLDDCCSSDVHIVGGKAAGLAEIIRTGYNVPPGFVIPAGFRMDWLHGKLDSSFDAQVESHCLGLDARLFAVRSSAIVEDGASASWAGQFVTFLGVEPRDVVTRIRACWESSGSAHVAMYANYLGAAGTHWDMAVVVQAMVASEVSGVLFTVDPVSKRDDVCSLEAVAGLGEPLVQGLVTPQSYLVDKSDCSILREFGHRQKFASILSEEGVRRVELPSDFPAPLTGALINRLVEIGNQLERHFGAPQDIEWAISGDRIFVLQSRPITTL